MPFVNKRNKMKESSSSEEIMPIFRKNIDEDVSPVKNTNDSSSEDISINKNKKKDSSDDEDYKKISRRKVKKKDSSDYKQIKKISRKKGRKKDSADDKYYEKILAEKAWLKKSKSSEDKEDNFSSPVKDISTEISEPTIHILEEEEEQENATDIVPIMKYVKYKEKKYIDYPLDETANLTSKDMWLPDEDINFDIGPTLPVPQLNPSLDNKWETNEPFVLHFLLEGYISDKIGNSSNNVASRFIELLIDMKTERSNEIAALIRRGQMDGFLRPGRIDEFPNSIKHSNQKLEDLVKDEVKKVKNIDDRITAGGYSNASGGHAIAFSFDFKNRRIFFTNSGEGLKFHKHSKQSTKYYKLYYVWEFEDDEEYQECAKKILGAIECRWISNIAEAYLYQVDVFIDKRNAKISFSDTGITPEATPLWLTHKSNWLIEDGDLYCKPQIAGSCTFHSIFWMILLDVWQKKGSLEASKVEKYYRNTVLNYKIDVGIKENNTAERLTCLALLVRTYPHFEQREQAIKTLINWNSNTYNLLNPIPSTVSVKLHSKKESDSKSIIKYIYFLYKSKDINRAVQILLSLIIIIYREIKICIKELRVLQENLQRELNETYQLYISNIAISAIKYTYNISQEHKETKVETLLSVTRCFIIYSKLVDENKLRYLHDVDDIFLILINRIHNSLEKDKILPPHSKSYDYPSNYLTRSYSCEAANFISNYMLYVPMEEPEELEDIQKKEWIKHTYVGNKNNELIYPLHSAQTKYAGIFNNFTLSSVVYECIVSTINVISYMGLNKTGDIYNAFDGDPFTSHLSLREINKPPMLEEINIHRKGISDSIRIISDLYSGKFLLDIKFNENVLPDNEMLLHTCITGDTDIVLKENTSYTLPEDFYNFRLEWMRQAWIRAANQIQSIVNYEDILMPTCIWLFYLWPEGPSNELIIEIGTIMKSKKIPIITTMLLIWLTRGKVDNLTDIIEEDSYLLGKEDKFVISFNTLKSLFAKTLFYMPQVAEQLINLVNPKIKGSNDKRYILDEELIPFHLKVLSWDEKEVNNKDNFDYSIGKSKLVTLEKYNKGNYLEHIHTIGQTVQITNAVWQENKDVKVEWYFGSEVLILNKDRLTTPTGETYSFVLPQDVPYTMRRWCNTYLRVVCIVLRQENKYYFLLANGNSKDIIKSKRSVFNIYFPYPEQFGWYIYAMQDNLTAPTINRDTPGLEFLAYHLSTCGNIYCLSILKRFVTSLDNTKSNITRYTDMSICQADSQRDKYTHYLNKEYNLEDPQYGDPVYRLAYVMSSLVTPLQIELYLPLLMNCLYTNLNLGNFIIQRPKSRAIFEIITGKILRLEQIELLEEMKNDLINKEAKVRIALMGIGKSKILVPMLIILSILNNKRVTVVQPEHLVLQTTYTLDEIIPVAFNNYRYDVISDTKTKADFLSAKLNNGYYPNDHIVLFDEIDNMYDVNKSEYNIPDTPTSHPLNLNLEAYYDLVVNMCYNTLEKTQDLGLDVMESAKFIDKFGKDFYTTKSMKHYYNYGMSNHMKEYMAVPYSAIKTPIEGAVFSDIDITAILSCLIRKKSGLNQRDFILLLDRVKHWNQIIGVDKILHYNVRDLLALSTNRLVEVVGKDIELQRFYLQRILLPEKLFSYKTQYNVSFIDLMSSQYSMQRIGFSGTDAIHLPRFKDYNWTTIVPDPNGEAKIKESIIGWDKRKGIYPYTISNMWKLLTTVQKNAIEYDVLIDSDALLRKYTNSVDVVKEWSLQYQINNIDRKKIIYVFIDEDDKAREYIPDKETYDLYKYRLLKPNEKFKWYFDQKHTIGTDLKLAPKARALALLTSKTKFNTLAQAIYRLRQIGKDGQSTHFMIKGGITSNRTQLYDLLRSNDDRFKDNLLHKHYVQNYKVVVREERSTSNNVKDSYWENIVYYRNEVPLPRSGSKLALALMDRVYKSAYIVSEEVDMQHQQAQEREQEREKEQVYNIQGNLGCYKQDTLEATDADYLDEEYGIIGTALGISISPYVMYEKRSSYPQKQALDYLCFIILNDKQCKIITIEESIILKARNKLHFNIVYRGEPIPKNATASYLLALAVCDVHLPLKEQLIIIRNITRKIALRKLVQCFNILQYDIMLDYLNSNMNSVQYLKSFPRNETDFVRRWIKWSLDSTKVHKYWQECMDIIGN